MPTKAATAKEAKEPKELTEAQKAELARQQELLANIARLGGQGMKEEDVVYEGSKLVLPERFRGSLEAVIEYLVEKQTEEETVSPFIKVFNYRPQDGARNAFIAMKKAFGMVTGKATFFTQPTYVQVPISYTESEEVPWGKFVVPMMPDTAFYFGATESPEYGPVFQLQVHTPRKNKFIVEGLFKLIEKEIEANSIYRGGAIDGQVEPQFLDVDSFDPNSPVYSEQVFSDLEAHLWSVLRYTKAHQAVGLPLKRSILLTGQYGTGKSLAGMKTAFEAVQAGWTFIMARPGRDDFGRVMQLAKLYQPAVVFMEDVDQIASNENQDSISRMLDLFDGIQAKGTQLVVVLTTNHPHLLHKGMLRPGRVDAVIEIGALDATGIEKLVRKIVGDNLEDPIDFAAVAHACEEYMPAFVKEAADRSLRYALSRSEGNVSEIVITTEDLVLAANGLRDQFNRMQGAKEWSEAESLGQALTKLVSTASSDASKKAVAQLAPSPDDIYDGIAWNAEEIQTVRNSQN